MVLKLSGSKLLILIGIICCIISLKPHTTDIDPLVSYHHPLKILIIDAGHGGADGGAVGIDGTIESDLNLDIALKLEALGHLYGVDTVMTRTMSDISYPKDAQTISEKKLADQNARLRLIRDYPNAIFYSIHQNYYPNSSVSGIHVFYGKHENSNALGERLQMNFNQNLPYSRGRVAAPIDDSIYLMKHSPCPSVLIECGFISNSDDLALLKNESHRKKLAVIMLASFLQYNNSERNGSET